MLEDTLVGFQLQPYRRARKRKPVATAKFYFFDVGVANVLMKRGEIRPGSELYGAALEHQIFLELRAYLDYRRLDKELTFWRTHSGYEVDFVVGTDIGVEVKASRRVSPADQKGLLALSEDVKLKKKVIVCGEPRERVTDEGIVVLPLQVFFERLWSDRLLE
jgi:predicted AAA+ superfamily ATPase